MDINRRDFGKLALAAAATPRRLFAAKPNSMFSGVQIGTITYSFRSDAGANSAEPLLKLILDSGISAVELMPPAAENFAGSPAASSGGARSGGGARGGAGGAGGADAPGGGRSEIVVNADGSMTCPGTGGRAGAAAGGGGGRGRGAPTTPEQQAAQTEAAKKLKDWRLSVSMDGFKAFRKMYNDAGVGIYCHKLAPAANMSDEEYNYMFNVAAALGAKQVSLELSEDRAYTQRLGDFAAQHGMLAAYHGHLQSTVTAWDDVLAQSKGNAVNLDCGHYVAGTGLNPIPAIQKYGEQGRLASLHMKDRTTPAHCEQNLPWGKGDTPIAEILQLIRKNKWKFPVSIELEYQIPQGSNAVAEVTRCLEFCKKALV